MTLKYGLQVWDTQAFSVLVQNSSAGILDLIDTNEQRARLQQKQCSPTKNTLAFADDLQELAEMLSSVHPWMKTYLQDLSAQFQQQSTAVLTINVPEHPSKFTILAYFVMMLARQHHMVTYNAAGDFYILPVLDRVLTSRFPELYKNNINSIPSDAHIKFMKVYRQALIAEHLVQPTDLIDWDQYSIRDNECDFKASKMVEQSVISYFHENEVRFSFDEKNEFFSIPIKQSNDVNFYLDISVGGSIEYQGIGTVSISAYISVSDYKALSSNHFMQNVDEKFKQYFGKNIQRSSITAIFDLFDFRERINNLRFIRGLYRNSVCEYNTWPDFFTQLDQLINASIKIISDIDDINFFLKILEDALQTGLSLEDVLSFQMSESLCVCYLMYAKLFRPEIFPILAKFLRKKYTNKKPQKGMFDLIDYIQNYELPT